MLTSISYDNSFSRNDPQGPGIEVFPLEFNPNFRFSFCVGHVINSPFNVKGPTADRAVLLESRRRMETMQETIQKELTDISHELAGVLAETEGIPGLGNGAVTEWTRVCRDVERQLGDAAIRVAVVGAIKSGKSTFVNALFGGDYLKRGAGVVTSIVTRIRPGDRKSVV